MFALISRFFSPLFKSGNSILVAVLLAVMVAAYRGGYKQGRTEGDRQTARLQQQRESERHSEAQRRITLMHQLQTRYQQQVIQTSRLDAQYQQKLQQLEADNAQLQQQITRVTRRYVDNSGKSHPVSCVFTRGFVQQYNAAFGHGDNTAATAGSTGTAAGTVPAADTLLRDSGVSQRDVLAAASDAGHQCRRLAAQVNGLLDYIEMQHRRTP